jgi:RNA polymerase sigma-70 factor (ECF subfamily)
MNRDLHEARSQREFETKSWTVVLQSCQDNPEGRRAFDELCQAYWYPLYAYLRRKGSAPQDAEDMIQSFFVWILERGLVERADPLRGRFRTFLLAALNQFEARQYQYESAAKRSPGNPLVSLDIGAGEATYSRQGVEHETPETLYEQAWAASLLDQAISSLRADMQAGGKAAQFDCLRGLMTSQPGTNTRLAAQRLEMTKGAVRVALHRMKRRFAEKVRGLVAATVENEDEIEDEMTGLFLALQKSQQKVV